MSLTLFRILLLGFLLQPWAAFAAVQDVVYVNDKDLVPSKIHRQSAVIITRVVERYHVRKVALDDKLSKEILKRYLEALDPNRSFFNQQDVNGFEKKYQTRLDNALKTADLDGPFLIFREYRKRVEQRIALALAFLDSKLDFGVDEDFRFDRSKAPWPKDEAEVQDLWRKRVKNDILALRMIGKPEDEIKTTLMKRYQNLEQRVFQINADEVFQTFINAYTMSLEPHTSYMSPEASENFDISMRLSLEGIGAVLRTKNEHTEIVRTVPGGPAEESGQIFKGDRIIAVGQGDKGEMENVIGLRLQDVVEKIRGPKGSTVRVEILPKGTTGGTPKVVALKRNEIKLEDQAAKKRVISGLDGMGQTRIGMIELPAFYRDFQGQSSGNKDFRSTTKDVRKLIQELKNEGVEGIVIDLRGNGGGSLTEATELTGLFIKTGPVVQVLDSNGHLDIEKDEDPEIAYKGPLAVLVNSDSASASEIFAGAIQDYGRGIIIGEATFGKGTVQTLINLGRFIRSGEDDLGRLRLTMAQFYRISGSSTQFKGVVPDITFEHATAEKDQGERALDNALPWSSIKPVRNVELIKKKGINDLLPAHRERVKKDPGFKYLQEENRILKKMRDQHSVSLLETKRRQEWQATELARRSSENRFRTSVGLKLLPESPDTERDEDDEEGSKALAKVEQNEAAIILSDYIKQQKPAETAGTGQPAFNHGLEGLSPLIE
jgi:carboxyl-terminal processing protease